MQAPHPALGIMVPARVQLQARPDGDARPCARTGGNGAVRCSRWRCTLPPGIAERIVHGRPPKSCPADTIVELLPAAVWVHGMAWPQAPFSTGILRSELPEHRVPGRRRSADPGKDRASAMVIGKLTARTRVPIPKENLSPGKRQCTPMMLPGTPARAGSCPTWHRAPQRR